MLNLNHLANIGGNKFLSEYRPIFLNSCQDSLDELDIHLENQDWIKIDRIAHKLIGTLQTLGENEPRQLLLKIKEEIERGNYNQSVSFEIFYEKYYELEKYVKSEDLKKTLDKMTDNK